MDLPERIRKCRVIVNKNVFQASHESNHERGESTSTSTLVERARQGDDEAFGELVRQYHERVYHVAFRFVRNVDEANDLAQQAWVRAWKRLDSFQGKSGFFTWMYRVVSTVCLDHLRWRKRKAEQQLLDDVEFHPDAEARLSASARSQPDQDLERKEIRQRFREGLEKLSPEHRIALMMREVDGLSYNEIAKVMNCRRGTVMSRIFYARKNLQGMMKDLQ